MAALVYLFDNGTETLALLVSLVVVPLAAWGLLMVSGKHVDINLEKVETDTEKYDVGLNIVNNDIIPVAILDADVRCINLRTGEEETITITKSLKPKGKTSDMLSIVPDHAGRYRISIDKAKIYDPLRLCRREINAGNSVYITIMPELFDIRLSVTSSASAMPESDRYVDDKTGNDPGDVRAIREYVPGDPVKNIHWKLSEKTDKMLVKELGLPITEQFLVILDNAADVGLNPEALDVIVSVFSSVITSLSLDGLSYTAGWTNPETGTPMLRTVNTEYDLAEIADEYLAVPATIRSAFEIIDRGLIDSRFAHLILVGSRIPDGIDSISNGCKVTMLMYGADDEVRMDAGVSLIGFDKNSYMADLAAIEV